MDVFLYGSLQLKLRTSKAGPFVTTQWELDLWQKIHPELAGIVMGIVLPKLTKPVAAGRAATANEVQ